jgi:hypothetical protein
MAYIELNEEERANFFMQFFNDLDADEEFEGFDEFDIAENIEIVGGIDIEQAENDRDIRDDVEVDLLCLMDHNIFILEDRASCKLESCR